MTKGQSQRPERQRLDGGDGGVDKDWASASQSHASAPMRMAAGHRPAARATEPDRVEGQGWGDVGGPELRRSPNSYCHRTEVRGQSARGRMVARGALTGTVLDYARATPCPGVWRQDTGQRSECTPPPARLPETGRRGEWCGTSQIGAGGSNGDLDFPFYSQG